jgi:hypothetical protein
MSGKAGFDLEPRSDRQLARDELLPAGAKGALTVANGFRSAMLVITGLLTLACFVNVMTALDDGQNRGVTMSVWNALALEASSNGVLILLAPFVYLAVWQARRLSSWHRVALLAAVSVPFSLSHVALMTLARMAIFASVGQSYVRSWGDVPYEFRKDVITYIVLAGTFWFLTKPDTPIGESEAAKRPVTFHIQDGTTLIRVPIDDILAARAADNYVEFMLTDGRRPLMRASLANVEARLSSTGIVRTHRSWLANTRHVRSITPAGSGDFRLDLGQNVIVPLSRRYPAVVASLKVGPSAGR